MVTGGVGVGGVGLVGVRLFWVRDLGMLGMFKKDLTEGRVREMIWMLLNNPEAIQKTWTPFFKKDFKTIC